MAQHHVFEGERLAAFSDAVFAIVATIMVIPLKITDREIADMGHPPNGTFFLTEWLSDGTFFLKGFVYVFAYILVVHFWYSHNKLFRLVERVDDILAWLNLAYLLFVSFLPATIVLVYSFPDTNISLTISIANIILVNCVMLVSIFFAFRQKSLLHPELLKNTHLFHLKFSMYLPLLIGVALGVLAIIFSWAIDDNGVGTFFFFCMSFVPGSTRVIMWLVNKKLSKGKPPNELHRSLSKTVVSKERMIAFSDGVFSIVGTLLILDITTTEIPNAGSTSDDVVKEFLHKNQYEFITYLATFFIIGLLWFVHHSMLQYFKEITPWLTAFNSLSLMFTGLIPLGSGLVGEFSEGNNAANEIAAIQVFSVLLILAGTSQLLLWAVAHCDRRKCLTSDVSIVSVEAIQLTKLLIFPIVGLFFYMVSFSRNVTVHHAFIFLSLVTPVLFILPRLSITLKHIFFKSSKTCSIPVPVTSSSKNMNQKDTTSQDQYVLQIQKSPNSAEVEQNNPSITEPLLDNNNNSSDVKFV